MERSLKEKSEPGNVFEVHYKSEVHAFSLLTCSALEPIRRPPGTLRGGWVRTRCVRNNSVSAVDTCSAQSVAIA